jgi:hypothetical protein
MGASCLLLLGASVSIGFSDSAQSADVGDDTAKAAASTLPNIYLDLRTIYTTTPAGTLSIGFSNPSLSSALAALQSLAPLANSPALPTRPSPSRQSAAVDVPLTVDLSDRVSVYGGFSASASQIAPSDWSTFAVSSWNVGFQADLYEQKGGSIPTITLQSTFTRAVPDSPLATTSLNTILEFSYALNKDETKGLLAGVQDTAIAVDSALAAINPNLVGYVGAYYQWENNWKVTGRAGVQSFGGAQLIMFGVTAEIAWTPKPAYQLTVRTPLYAVRH